MTETVTDIIVSRARSRDGLKAMIVWSLGLHAAVIVGLVFAPAAKDDAPPVVMTISLSGSEGVRSEGMTQAGAQPVRDRVPPEVTRPVVAPPRDVPKMTLPDPRARPRTQPPTQATEPASPTATTAPSATRVRGQGFGLSTSGGGGIGGVTLDTNGAFCCDEYVTQMIQAIKTKWNPTQGVPGTTGMKFTILRDGTIKDIQVERPSGLPVLDNESRHALMATERLAPLPSAFTNASLTVHLLFDYSR